MTNQRNNNRRKSNRRNGNNNNTTKRAPVARSRRNTTGRPQMRADATKAVISHREYISDISGSILFNATQYALNPGNGTVFKWLSSIAINYETYRFTKLVFHYETAVSTTTAGTVMLAVDYDASDATPTTKQALMSFAQATRSAAWTECSYNCRGGDLSKFVKERYVRGASIPTGDPKTYDVGNLFLATQGTPESQLGELYVTYSVELRTPQTSDNLAVSTVPTSIGQGTLATAFEPLGTPWGLTLDLVTASSFWGDGFEWTPLGLVLDPTRIYVITCAYQVDPLNLPTTLKPYLDGIEVPVAAMTVPNSPVIANETFVLSGGSLFELKNMGNGNQDPSTTDRTYTFYTVVVQLS